MAKNDTPQSAKAHIRYKTSDGKPVPGVSTIVGQVNKPQLVPWANRLGLQGIDSSKYTSDKASIGTLAHHLIMCGLKGEPVSLEDYTTEQVSQGETAYLHYLEWCKGKVIKPILVETPLVSELHKYGGTLDFYGDVDGIRYLMDYKTGGIYGESTIQACGYVGLLEDCGYPPPEKIIILGIPRDDTETFREVTVTNFEHGKTAFMSLLVLYEALKYIK